MRKSGKKLLFVGSIFNVAFIVWILLIQKVDVQPLGVNGTDIGFATINCWFHKLTGVHMMLYAITDWLGLIPIFICMIFGAMGLIQLIQRRSVFKVDYDIIFLGIYYMIVILGYLIFEMIPINYRPILIEGFMEASYPSSTTLLVLCVMPTLSEQVNRRSQNEIVKKVIKALVICFSAFMVFVRLISGVHWLTDIVGSIMLSVGLFCIYKAAVLLCFIREN
ncbi:MAG: phosphatase PAP2 family protein [Lachnospiraceae bacterium]|nr:phosphatase PAP2 family protein [Lachnospiraceae bacterium]